MTSQQITNDTQFGFLDSTIETDRVFHPKLISNEYPNTMLHALKRELDRSTSFIFSVAFITRDALAALKQALLDFNGTGKLITSTYLNFNDPDVFRELLTLEKVEVFIHPPHAGGFHAKGYVFEQPEGMTAIIGSSNLTSKALLQNKEWNLRISALPGGDIVTQLRAIIDAQITNSTPLSTQWIDEYAELWESLPRYENPFESEVDPLSVKEVQPNKMQISALESIDAVRSTGETRAVVISATGTGKTILSALDVRAINPKNMLFVVHREQILDDAIVAFQKVLGEPAEEFGKFVGQRQELDKKYVFATVQSVAKQENLAKIDRSHFEYVLIDEVHRAGADSYLRLIDWLQPKFLLGMTATPERTDDFNIFELFDHNVPYEIRLQAALEEGMLAPFHYYGVTDYVDLNGNTIDEAADLVKLVADERVRHLLDAMRRYGHPRDVRGLIFCSRNEEALELTGLLNECELNGRRLRTKALSGTDPIQARDSAILELESGELDYLLSVDIFNEGIDIPTINQIIMLRQTKSSIVFTQQLGRGLRKSSGKDHLRVIDFIGNYTNNYLIPIALLGDSSLNKDTIKQKLIAATDGSIAGLSSINFDIITRERIYQSLASVKLDSIARLKSAILDLKQRLGVTPKLMDFARFDTVDPVVVATRRQNYWSLLHDCKFGSSAPTERQAALLNFLSAEILNGKRPHELLLLKKLLTSHEYSSLEYEFELYLSEQSCTSDQTTIQSVSRMLSLEFFTQIEQQKYGGKAIVELFDGVFRLSAEMRSELEDAEFRDHVEDIIETGLYLARHQNNWGSELILGKLYSRRDVCRLLNWTKNEYSTIYGYKVDYQSNTCPIFVTYHKSDGLLASINYEDELLDSKTMQWFTRSRRTMASNEVQSITSGEVSLHVFVKKDDSDGRDFYYLGKAQSRDAMNTEMPYEDGSSLPVVKMKLDLETPIEDGLYRYLTEKPNI